GRAWAGVLAWGPSVRGGAAVPGLRWKTTAPVTAGAAVTAARAGAAFMNSSSAAGARARTSARLRIPVPITLIPSVGRARTSHQGTRQTDYMRLGATLAWLAEGTACGEGVACT